MKTNIKKIPLIIFFCFSTYLSFAQSWENISNGVGVGGTRSQLHTDRNNVLHIVVPSVMKKFINNQWIQVGGVIPNYTTHSFVNFTHDFVFDNDNVPFILYQSSSYPFHDAQLYLARFINGVWENIDLDPESENIYIETYDTGNLNLEIDSNNNLYFSVISGNISKILKYDGLNFDTVFSKPLSQAYWGNLKINSNDELFFLYTDLTDNENIILARKDSEGTNWIDLQLEGYNSDNSYYSDLPSASLTFTSSNNPIIAFSNSIYENQVFYSRIKVIKHENGNWISLPDLEDGHNFLNLVLDASDKPYISYSYFDEDLMTTYYQAKTLNGTNWEFVGENGNDLGRERGSMIIDENGILFLSTHATGSNEANIWKFETALGISNEDVNLETTLYPNPAKESFSILSSLNIVRIEIYNQTGQLVQSSKNVNNSFDVSRLGNGVYVVKLYDENNRSVVKKLVVKK